MIEILFAGIAYNAGLTDTEAKELWQQMSGYKIDLSAAAAWHLFDMHITLIKEARDW